MNVNYDQILYKDDKIRTRAHELGIEKHYLCTLFSSDNYENAVLCESELEEARQLYKDKYSDTEETFDDFLNSWKIWKSNQNSTNTDTNLDKSTDTADLPYLINSESTRFIDTRTRKPPVILLPFQNRGRPEPFDVYKFINQKEACNDVYRLNIDPNGDETVLDVMYETQTNQDKQADHNLRKIARMVMILNQSSDHRVLECHSERRIN